MTITESLSESATPLRWADCASEGGPVMVSNGTASSSSLEDLAQLSRTTMSPHALSNCVCASVTERSWTKCRKSLPVCYPSTPLASFSESVGTTAHSSIPLSLAASLFITALE